MILNAYSFLALFVGLLEFGFGLLVAFLSARALWRRRRLRAAGNAAALSAEPSESTLALVLLASGVLLGVSVASWPLLYLLLDSYVSQWQDVMCIQGVARIGTGTVGLARFLPPLVTTLEATKPLLLLAAGTWLLVHLANRRTVSAPLTGRMLAVVLATGAIAAVDAGAQTAYVLIPKKEEALSRGCCVLPTELGTRSDALGGAPARETPKTGLSVVFFTATLSMAG